MALLSEAAEAKLQHTATLTPTPQHTATHCRTLPHTATHCNILQYTANTATYTATVDGAPVRSSRGEER